MSNTVAVLEAKTVTSEEIASIRETVAQIADTALANFLTSVLDTVQSGKTVAAASTDTMLSAAQAARALNVSRPHLYKILDSGALRFTRVGNRRRVEVADLLEYRERLMSERANLAEAFASADRDRSAAIADLAGVDEETARRLGF